MRDEFKLHCGTVARSKNSLRMIHSDNFYRLPHSLGNTSAFDGLQIRGRDIRHSGAWPVRSLSNHRNRHHSAHTHLIVSLQRGVMTGGLTVNLQPLTTNVESPHYRMRTCPSNCRIAIECTGQHFTRLHGFAVSYHEEVTPICSPKPSPFGQPLFVPASGQKRHTDLHQPLSPAL